MALCDIPGKIAEQMTTKELATYVVAYPYWLNLNFFSNILLGIDAVISNS